MSTQRTVIVIALALICGSSTAWAQEKKVTATPPPPQKSVVKAPAAAKAAEAGSPWTQETGWANRAKGKLIFGLKNTFFGWTAPFTAARKAVQSKPAILQASLGFLEGLGTGVIDTLGGAENVLTFPVTAFDITLPENGVHLF